MALHEFKLPEVSEGVEKAIVTTILVSKGDSIEADQNVVEIESEKATLEIPAGVAGTVQEIAVSEGDEVPTGGLLMKIETEGGEETGDDEDQAKADQKEKPDKKAPKPDESEDAQQDDQAAKPAAKEKPDDGETLRCQLAVIGAGPGGYEAALHAAQHGIDTVLIEADTRLGGVCLQRGCIPSKTLLNIGHMLHETASAEKMGLRYQKPEIDLDTMRQYKDQVIDRLSRGIASLMKSNKVRTIEARARFLDNHSLALDGPDAPARVEFENCLIATGSRPVFPKAFDIGDPRVMDSTNALDLEDIPGRLLVIGGGYIGLELGSVYASLGSRVTVVELLDEILAGADRDLVKPLEKRLEKQLHEIRLGTLVESLEPADDGIGCKFSRDDETTEETFDRVLVSMGRRPVTEGLDLENTGVSVNDRGFIEVDAQQRTSEPHIYAIGDVAGDPMLAHKATREGKVAAEAIAGQKTEFDNVAIPAVVFTDPEIAWCGLSEKDAAERGIDYEIGRFQWVASGRATALDATDGLTKILFEPGTQRVLGVGIVGLGAGDLIAEGVVAVEMAAVARDVAESIHPHPTLSETLAEAAAAFLREKH